MAFGRPPAELRYLLPAVEEYRAQCAHYRRSAGSGVERSFIEAIRAAEALARGNPTGFPLLPPRADLRVIVVRRFPFRLFYSVENGTVVVVAIAHTARGLDEFLHRH